MRARALGIAALALALATAACGSTSKGQETADAAVTAADALDRPSIDAGDGALDAFVSEPDALGSESDAPVQEPDAPAVSIDAAVEPVDSALPPDAPVPAGPDAAADASAPPDAAAPPDAPPPLGRTWTLLVYMVADNNLERAALVDLAELASVGSTPDAEILVQIDRVPGWTTDPALDAPDFTGTKRFRVEKNHLVELQDLGELDMAAPAALASFLQWGLHRAPAQHTALVLWDHGGAQRGFGVDETNRSIMTLDELQTALAVGLGPGKLDLLGFDACLMAQLEIAHAVSRFARWYVASEESEPEPGWLWSDVARQLVARAEPEAVARAIPPSYRTGISVAAPGALPTITMSVIDLDRVEDAWEALQALGDGLLSAAASGHAYAVAYAMTDLADAFGVHPGDAPSGYTVDAVVLARALAGEVPALAPAAAVLEDAIDRAVVVNVAEAQHAGAHGLSVYANLADGKFDADYQRIEGTTGSPWFDGLLALRSELEDHTAPVLSSFQTTVGPSATVITANVTSNDPFRVSWYLAEVLTADSLAYLLVEPAFLDGTTLAAAWQYQVFLPSDGVHVALTTLLHIDTFVSAEGLPTHVYASSGRYRPPGGVVLRGVLYTFVNEKGIHLSAFYASDSGLTAAMPLVPGGEVQFDVLVASPTLGTTWLPLDQVLVVPQQGLSILALDALPGVYEMGFLAEDVSGNTSAAWGFVELQ